MKHLKKSKQACMLEFIIARCLFPISLILCLQTENTQSCILVYLHVPDSFMLITLTCIIINYFDGIGCQILVIYIIHSIKG